MSENNKQVLQLHLEYIRNRLQMYAKSLGIGRQPHVKGMARDGVIKLFLRDNLPSAIEFTNGEVIDEYGSRSGLIDILVQSSFAPKINLFGDIKLAFADSVLAAIEVKADLVAGSWNEPSHLKTSLDSIAKIKRLKRNHLVRNVNGARQVTLTSTPGFVLAYHGPSSDVLVEQLNSYGERFGLRQEQYWPEVVTVLDQGYYIVNNDSWFVDTPGDGKCSVYQEDTACLTGMYVYLCMIIEAWSRENHPIQVLRYFQDLSA